MPDQITFGPSQTLSAWGDRRYAEGYKRGLEDGLAAAMNKWEPPWIESARSVRNAQKTLLAHVCEYGCLPEEAAAAPGARP